MVEEPKFHFWHRHDERRLTAAEAETALVDILTDPAGVRAQWEMLAGIDWWLLVLGVIANPVLRDELWDATVDGEPVLSERMKFFMAAHPLENDEAAAQLVRNVVHDVVAARYEAVTL